ncbi:hypothetical protein JL721_9344 [Aureococcus anophagefferens]|nr:hypothetical protein JL721_9344 [Aureococcus anophagefferens]
MADATLPAGWTRHHHRESGVDFYVHEASGETQWQPPADDGLAPGWHAVVDEATGETYCAHAETHETSWAKPRSGWAKVTSGDDVYYAHRGTAETTWERPAGYESPAEDGAIDAAADAPPAGAPAPPRGADVGDGWHRVLDPETQEHYYAHRESSPSSERDDDGLSIADSLFDHRGSLVFQWDEDDVEAADDARWRKRQARQRARWKRGARDPATGAVLDAFARSAAPAVPAAPPAPVRPGRRPLAVGGRATRRAPPARWSSRMPT